MGNNAQCPLDHAEWKCVSNNVVGGRLRNLPSSLEDAVRKIAASKGITVRLFMEICMRRIVEEHKEWLK